MTRDKKPSPVVIAIDGPAGAGKSTVAKELAKRLGFAYLDTGAMYRALTLKALKEKINLEDEAVLINLAQHTMIDIEMTKEHALKVTLDGLDVTEAIRTLEVTNNTFYVARVAGVREFMVKRQREIGQKRSVVVEGRDIGTVVFPNATKKFFLDADFKERAKRRTEELKAKGKDVDGKAIAEDLKERDTKDTTRRVGPLKKAADAVVIDSTYLSIEDVIAQIISSLTPSA